MDWNYEASKCADSKKALEYLEKEKKTKPTEEDRKFICAFFGLDYESLKEQE